MDTKQRQERNKRLNFPIREDLHKWIKVECAKRGISIADLIEEWTEEKQNEGK